jgi:molybdopterin-guanine dinucleotide biosynthesis protein MobB
MSIVFPKPLIGIAAYSGTGKTTLLTQLIPELTGRGLRLAVVKHAHHDFEIDYPAKDSYKLRKAGATQMLIASRTRWALVTEHEDHGEPRLQELLRNLDSDGIDLVLVEGFKEERFPKIELHRNGLRSPLLFLSDDSVIAVACDVELPGTDRLPILNINDIAQIADFIEQHLVQSTAASG